MFGLTFLASAGVFAGEQRASQLRVPEPQIYGIEAVNLADARLLLERKKWDEAIIVLKSLYRRNPNLSQAGLDLVEALAYSRRREEAVSTINQLISREKSNERRQELYQKADVLSRLFYTNDVFQIYQDGLNLLRAGKLGAARIRLEKALSDEPDNAEILLRLGQCLLLDHDTDSASERLKLARKLNPYRPEIKLWLGRAMTERGEQQEAVNELRSAYKDLDHSALSGVWYADALVRTGQRVLAIQTLETHLNQWPGDFDVLFKLAEIRLASRDQGFEEAWAAKRDLQVLASRLQSQTEMERASSTPGELDLDLQLRPEEARVKVQKMLEQVQALLSRPSTL